jgi:hypothetical protein
MNLAPTAALLGFAALAVMPIAGAAAEPIAGNTIALQGYLISESPSAGTEGLVYQGHVRVTFRNDGDVTATAVTFDVGDGSRNAHIVDVGTFSKGVTIKHEFHWLDTRAGDTLQVVQVRYADGSVWNGDGASTTAAPRLQSR